MGQFLLFQMFVNDVLKDFQKFCMINLQLDNGYDDII